MFYQLAQENVETFFVKVERETETDFPNFVKERFDAFLDYGILDEGFLHLRRHNPASLAYQPEPSLAWAVAGRSQLTLQGL